MASVISRSTKLKFSEDWKLGMRYDAPHQKFYSIQVSKPYERNYLAPCVVSLQKS